VFGFFSLSGVVFTFFVVCQWIRGVFC
jgi:hypothetical protein